MSDTVVDSIKIEVEGDSRNAVDSIDKLISSLEKIEKVTSGGNRGLDSLQQRLDRISSVINGIDAKGMDKLSALTEKLNALNGIGDIDMGKNADKITQISAAVDTLKNADLDKLTDLTSALQGLNHVENVNIPAINTPSIPNPEIPQIPAFDEHIETAHEAMVETKSLNAELKETEAHFAKLNEKLAKIGETGEKTGSKLKKVESSFSKFMGFTKRMLQFYVVYSGINIVLNSFKEGIANVYQYSKALGGSLASSLDSLATSTNYLKNSIGAAATPLIEVLAPATDWVVDKFVALLNVANRVFAFLAGKSTWTKAIRVQTEYAEATEAATDANKDLKKSLLDIDEINRLSDNSTKALTNVAANKNPTYAFEEVPLGDLQTPEIAAFSGLIIGGIEAVWTALKGVWDKIKALKIVAAFTKGFNSIKTNGGNTFQALKGGLRDLRSKLGLFGKGVIGAAGAFTEFEVAKEIFKGIDSGADFSAGKIAGLGTAATAAADIMYAALGPKGLAIAAISGLAGAFRGLHEDEVKYYEETLRKEYYEKQGTAIDKVKDALNNYFKALNFDKQNEWIEKVNASEQAYKDALTAYDDMWNSISKKTTFDTSDIEGLTNAFNDLTAAAKALNDVKIDSVMESIKSGIQLNITDELNGELGSVLDKLNDFNSFLGVEISGLNAEYQELLKQIQKQGGTPDQEQIEKLQALKNDLTKFTLSSDTFETATTSWKNEIALAIKGGIEAGTNKDKVIANVKDLMSDRDTYLKALKEKWAQDETTLKQVLALNGGDIARKAELSLKDLDTLKESYYAQLDAVNEKFDQVLAQISKTYAEGILDWSIYHDNDSFADALTTAVTTVYGVFSTDAQKYLIDRKLSEEQKDLLEQLSGFYANPENALTYNQLLEWVQNRESERVNGEVIPPIADKSSATTSHIDESTVAGIINKSAITTPHIDESVVTGLTDANSEQNALLHEQNKLLKQILDKDTTVKAYVTTKDLVTSLDRKNRRDGRTVVPVALQ